MSTLTFDTLRYVERLRAAGVTEEQDKAEAEALRDALAQALDATLATRTRWGSHRAQAHRARRALESAAVDDRL